MARSLDTINSRQPSVTTTGSVVVDEPPMINRSSSSATGFILAGLMMLGAFFLATRPSADSQTNTGQPTVASSTPITTSTTSQIGLPQPDQGQSLEHAVILDHPLATSQAQDGTVGGTGEAAATTPISSIKPDSFTLRILNGSGQSGLATAKQSALTTKRFRVIDAGTAVNSYSTTVIYYTAGHQDQAKLLQSSLGSSGASLQQDEIAQPADILLVLGADASK